jgi:hypothetical protein
LASDSRRGCSEAQIPLQQDAQKGRLAVSLANKRCQFRATLYAPVHRPLKINCIVWVIPQVQPKFRYSSYSSTLNLESNAHIYTADIPWEKEAGVATNAGMRIREARRSSGGNVDRDSRWGGSSSQQLTYTEYNAASFRAYEGCPMISGSI